MVKRLLESGGGGEKQVSWLDVYERDAYEPEISDFLEKKNRALRRDILTNCQCEISDALRSKLPMHSIRCGWRHGSFKTK